MLRKAVIVSAALWAVLHVASASGATFVVNAGDFSFAPPSLTVNQGDSVRWTWGAGFHTTTSGTGSLDPQAGVLWDALLDLSHTKFARKFNTAGVFPYFCRNHELMGMTGTITVNAIPVARDSSVTTPENTLVGARMQAFDPDGDPLTYSILAGPFHGLVSSLNTATGTFNYSPNLGFVGNDSLRYTVNDGHANSNTATIRIAVLSACSCPNQGDINFDASIDVFDVIAVIGIAFSGDPDPQDPGCPKTRGDVNNDGSSDVFDVIYLIDTAFSGGPNPVNPCI